MLDDEWLPITEAAGRLTAAGDPLTQPSLSRYLQKHEDAIPVQVTSRAKLVHMPSLVAHRAENIRVAGQSVHQTTMKVAKGFAAIVSSPHVAPTKAGQAAALAPSARKALAEAELKELDLAQRRGELVPVAEVTAAAMEAIVHMKGAFDRAIDPSAAEAAVNYAWDERIARLAFKNFAKAGLETFHRMMLEQTDRLATGNQAAPEADTQA